MRLLKTVFLALIVVFSLTASLQAKVYYPQNQTVYVQPDPYYQTGVAIANIFGALLDSSAREKEERQIKEGIAQIRAYLQNSAQSEVKLLSGVVGEYGVDATITALEQHLYSNGYRYSSGRSNGVAYVAYTYKFNNNPDAPDTTSEYSIHEALGQCRVMISVPYFNISEFSVANYYTTPPTKYESYEPLSIQEPTQTSIGIKFSDARASNGGIVINSIETTSTAYYSGLRKGDVITRIDSYQTKDHPNERIVSYLTMRIGQRINTSLSVIRQENPINIDIRF